MHWFLLRCPLPPTRPGPPSWAVALLHQPTIIWQSSFKQQILSPSTCPWWTRSLPSHATSYQKQMGLRKNLPYRWSQPYPHRWNSLSQKTLNQACNHQVTTSSQLWKIAQGQIAPINNCRWPVRQCFRKILHLPSSCHQKLSYRRPVHKWNWPDLASGSAKWKHINVSISWQSKALLALILPEHFQFESRFV